MEQIVRPFQSTSVIKTKKLKLETAVADDTAAHLCWGDVGEVPDAVEQDDDFDGLNFRLEECNDDLSEKNRDSEDIKVAQDGKPENFVVFNRIRRITFKKEAKRRLLTAFRTETTAFPEPDVFAGSVFGDVPLTDSCNSSFHLNR